jgi:hypothetical protein
MVVKGRDFWLCWFVVLCGGFHGGVDIGSFVLVLVFVVVFVVPFGGGYVFCGFSNTQTV